MFPSVIIRSLKKYKPYQFNFYELNFHFLGRLDCGRCVCKRKSCVLLPIWDYEQSLTSLQRFFGHLAVVVSGKYLFMFLTIKLTMMQYATLAYKHIT